MIDPSQKEMRSHFVHSPNKYIVVFSCGLVIQVTRVKLRAKDMAKIVLLLGTHGNLLGPT
jgi:hypothetical protein